METNGMQTRPSERTCQECEARIPPERLRLLPDTFTCVKCSTEPKRTDVLEDGADVRDQVDSAQSASWDRSGHN